MPRFAPLFLALATWAGSALADGKFYGPPAVNLSLPYQRALIAFNGKQEAIVLQSSVQGAGAGPVGWVVPVPAMPQVGALDADRTGQAFHRLDRETAPKRYTSWVLLAIVLAFGFAVLTVMKMKLAERLIALVIIAILWASALPGERIDARVEVQQLGRAGDYDVNVLRAKQASDLVDWLAAAGFAHGQADVPAFEQYVREGWLFVTAKLAPLPAGDASERRGTRPLVLQFDTPSPIYPLRLTALAGGAVQFHLYVVADHRMDGDERFATAFAGPLDAGMDKLLAETRFAGNAVPAAFTGRYVTRLDATLEPARMSQDLRLKQSRDDTPYRGTVLMGR